MVHLLYSGTAAPTLVRTSPDQFPISVGDYNGDGAWTLLVLSPTLHMLVSLAGSITPMRPEARSG